MEFFFSPYFPVVALILLLFAIIYFGIVTIIRTRKNGSKVNIKVDKKTVNKAEINAVIHDLQNVEHRLRSIAE